MRKTLFFLLLVSGPLMAQDNIPETSGLSGYFLIGVGYFDIASNRIVTGPPLSGEVGKEVITSIFDSPESNTSFALPVAGEINYTFSKSRTQLFFGNKLEDILRLDVPYGLGIRQELPDKSIIAFSVLLTPLTLKFWEDPFVEGEERIRNPLNFPGLRFRWGSILKTGLEFTATLRNYRYDVEKSGDWLVSEGRLDPNQQYLLDRNGKVIRLQALYRIDVKGKHRFEPTFRYINDDHNGEAIANTGYGVKLTYLYRSQRLIVNANFGYGQRTGNDVHPVYGETLATTRTGGAIGLIVPVRATEKSVLSITAIGELFVEDTNINFYRTEIASVILGVIWRHRKQ